MMKEDRWMKLTTKGLVADTVPTFYVVKTPLEVAFDDKGTQYQSVNFWVLGYNGQFTEVMRQRQLRFCRINDMKSAKVVLSVI